MRIVFLVGGLALAVLVIVVVQLGTNWFAEPELPAEPEVVVTPIEIPEVQAPVVSAPPPKAVLEDRDPAEPEIVLPGLDDSDDFVLERIASFNLPKMWIEREDLMRRLAVVVDNASKGELPRRQLGFLAPTGTFKVIRRGETIFVDPVSYSRYNIYLDIVEKIDSELLAEVLMLFEPLLSDGLPARRRRRRHGGRRPHPRQTASRDPRPLSTRRPRLRPPGRQSRRRLSGRPRRPHRAVRRRRPDPRVGHCPLYPRVGRHPHHPPGYRPDRHPGSYLLRHPALSALCRPEPHRIVVLLH